MSFTFSPSSKVSSETNPRDWAYELAMCPNDVAIVFTKESLINYLKTHNVEVGPNYNEINKVPKFAKIGTLSKQEGQTSQQSQAQSATAKAIPEAAPQTSSSSPASKPTPTAIASIIDSGAPHKYEVERDAPLFMHNPNVVGPDGDVFRPTRRVREPIGGGSAQISALFGGNDDSENIKEASREQDRRRGLLQEGNGNAIAKDVNELTLNKAIAADNATSDDTENDSSNPAFRPSRRVREPGGTGGYSTITLG